MACPRLSVHDLEAERTVMVTQPLESSVFPESRTWVRRDEPLSDLELEKVATFQRSRLESGSDRIAT